jgi:hypothetical protein
VSEVLEIFLFSVRDGYIQVSAFVAGTVLIFSLIQYRSRGALLQKLYDNRRVQPLVGALMGLTPGCGGAIVMMPLYVRGTVSFGTVVSTLAATAGDSAFVILALAPEAALYVYAIAFVGAVAFGYAVDRFGLGVNWMDRALSRWGSARESGEARSAELGGAGAVPAMAGASSGEESAYAYSTYQRPQGAAEPLLYSRSGNGLRWSEEPTWSGGSGEAGSTSESFGWGANPAHDYEGARPAHSHPSGPDKFHPVLTPMSRAAHWVWWAAAALALALGIAYLAKGAPEVAFAAGLSFPGLFTIVGLTGTTLSFFLYFVGRHYIGEGQIGKARDSFSSITDTLQHAAMETSFVTVWVLAAYLVYEYPVGLLNLDIAAIAAGAGVLAPIAGAAIGLIPGCGPQIVLAGAYAQGAVPVSALAANAVSQDGDALFPLLAIDKKAALIATIYTVIPALVIGVLMHYLWEPLLGLSQFGFGVL